MKIYDKEYLQFGDNLLVFQTLLYMTFMYMIGFLGGSVGKESICNVGDRGSIPGLGRSPGEGISPVFWPGEFHGLYRPWGGNESDTTEGLTLTMYVIV